jgi:hypothetical protein
MFKLSAHDAEDLTVISALLQDAIFSSDDIAFLAKEGRFVVVVNRFKWESCDEEDNEIAIEIEIEIDELDDVNFEDSSFEDKGRYSRVQTGLRFEGVTTVQTRELNLNPSRPVFFNILAIDTTDQGAIISLSDGKAIRLKYAKLRCFLEDISEPWPSPAQPKHKLEEN